MFQYIYIFVNAFSPLFIHTTNIKNYKNAVEKPKISLLSKRYKYTIKVSSSVIDGYTDCQEIPCNGTGKERVHINYLYCFTLE